MKTSTFKNLQTFRAELNSRFLERDVVIDGLITSLITKQNAFLFGVPGTGKSELVRAVSNGFSGTNFFGYLLSPTTDPSELFGPVAVSKLLKDEYTRDVTGYLPTCNVAFLDELFRGSSAVLNSLLTILNERTFNNGKDVIETPIQSIVAATNSFPTEESLQAFCDRFLFRPTINLLQKPVSKTLLDMWGAGIEPRPEMGQWLTFDCLKELQEEAKNIKPSETFLEVYAQVLDMLATRGIEISDRRRVQILTFLKGWAVVQGEDKIYPEFLHSTLPHIVYQTPEDHKVISEVLEQCIQTPEKFIKESTRAVNGVMSEFQAWRAKHGTTVGEVNDQVVKMRRCHEDMTKIANKLDQFGSDPSVRMSAATRRKWVKLTQSVENDKQSIAKSISEISS